MPADVAIAAEPGSAKPDPVLTIDGMRRSFGGLRAVDIQHLEIQRNSITSIIGPNGAGKTTLFNLLTGFEIPDHGSYSLEGDLLVGVPAHQVAQRGMVRTFQLTKVLPRLSVLDNMLVAAKVQPGASLRGAIMGGWHGAERENEKRAREILDRFGLAAMADEYAATLSGGQRKLLEMARALMVRPTLIMLDEPTAGVNPRLIQSLVEHVRELRNAGMTVLLVEHDMDVVQSISDWVVVVAEGHVIAEGPPGVIARNPAVIEAYLGKHRGEDVE
ncbi:MAG TPA: ABC transporter ATP-binding protein [Candidatus Limnocylindria bacterium]|jgi:branched-chain amino acid transport system ATP-binding protein